MIFQTDNSPGFYYHEGRGLWKSVGGAGKDLANLVTLTAINASLLPGMTNSIDIGSSVKKWKDGYFTGTVTAGSLRNTSIAISAYGKSYGVYAAGTDTGVYGTSTGRFGVYGVSSNTTGFGVYGTGSGNYGVSGITTKSGATGTYGFNSSGKGIEGVSSTGYGVYGKGGVGYGVYGNGKYGVYGVGTDTGVYGKSSGYAGIVGVSSKSKAIGTYGYNYDGKGVDGESSIGYGVYGRGKYGVFGTGSLYGVYGEGTDSTAGVYGAGKIGIYAGSSVTGGIGIYSSTSGTDNTAIYGFSKNAVGIYGGTANPQAYAAIFKGNVFAYGQYQGSDAKLKKDVFSVDNALGIISELRPKYYDFRSDGSFAAMDLPKGKHFGFIAQEIEKVLPDLVKATEFNVTRAIADATASTAGEENTESGHLAKAKDEIIDFKAVNYTERKLYRNNKHR